MPCPALVAVVGATAAGKSEAAVAIAEALDGEVVNADAYQVYEGMDIGSAKPSAALRSRVRHHLFDITTPARPLTLARYLDLAHTALADVWSRGKLPVLVGGSGQYVWALVEGWSVPRVAPDPALRLELKALARDQGAAALLDRLRALDPDAAARLDPHNTRRMVRALEVVVASGRPLAARQTRAPIDADVLVLGLRCDRAELYRRIDARVDAMYNAGLVDEVQRVRERGWGDASPVTSGIGYKEASAHLDGALTLDDAIECTKARTHRLVRTQSTWFKPSDARIRWVDAGDEASAECVEAVRQRLTGRG